VDERQKGAVVSENGRTTIAEGAGNERLTALFGELHELLKDFIRRNEIGYDEWHPIVTYLNELGQSGEIPLMMDLFLESTVDEVTHKGSSGTTSAIEGPYYVEGAPILEAPYELPRRENEAGDVLFFSGTVRGEDGAPLAGALVDIWQSDGNGKYSDLPPFVPSYDPDAPHYNLRGRLHAGPDGAFEVRSVVPAPYEIPSAGPTGRLYKLMGVSTFRPAHVHLKIGFEGYEPLTTQLYFEGDENLATDAAMGATKDDLILKLEKHDDPEDYRRRGLEGPYYTLHYDFVLAWARQKVTS
jgi:catechol 1,2-dioxygenase